MWERGTLFAVVRSEPIVNEERRGEERRCGERRRAAKKLIMRCCADKVAKIGGAAALVVAGVRPSVVALLSEQLSHFTLR